MIWRKLKKAFGSAGETTISSPDHQQNFLLSGKGREKKQDHLRMEKARDVRRARGGVSEKGSPANGERVRSQKSLLD